MSAICGLVNLDGRPIEEGSMEAMLSALADWGPDGCTVARTGCAGLGHSLHCTTPESNFERMPVREEAGQTLLVATARLDNREELCDIFEISAEDRPTTPDGRLVHRAYMQWGEKSPQHLLGDWSFATWDQRLRRMFLARDQLGNTGLFYYHKPPFFAFASSPHALLALAEVPRKLDEWQIARYLTVFPDDASHTFWEGIHSLLPGRSLRATALGLHMQTYWRAEDAPDVRLGSDEEYVEGLLQHYRTAVRSRLRSIHPVGVTLSSGLDSGSLTALAAEALRERGERLTAFTSVPLYAAEHLVPGAIANEWPLAHAVAEHCGNVEHVSIRAKYVSPLSAVERLLGLVGQPVHAAANLFWINALHDEAKRRGLGALLTGQLGNGGLSWSGGQDRIFYLFSQGDWISGRRSLAEWRAYHGHSWFRAVKSQLLRPLLQPYRTRILHLAHVHAGPWAEYSAIHPDFAKRLGLREAMRASGHLGTSGRPIPPLEERLLVLCLNGAVAGPFWHSYGAAFGLEVRDPTADVRLLEFCFGIPEERHVHRGGTRMAVREAMEGLLPREVQWNTRRGRQAADVALRLLAYPREMDSTLNRVAAVPAAAEILDIAAMRDAWQALKLEVAPQNASRAASLLLRGLMAGLFLESQKGSPKGGDSA